MKFKHKKVLAGQMGLGFSVQEMTRVPDSNWQPVRLSDLPDRLEGEIGVDTETCDYGLQDDRGAGWAWRGGGQVVGYSISADNFRGYLSLAHEGGDNIEDPNQARRWLRHVLGREDQTKIFAHAQYDIGWARRDGVEIKGPCVDVQWVEALLNENRREYNLDSIAEGRLGLKKNEDLLAAAAKAHGFHEKKELWRLPARYVGPYAEVDADLPREIWKVQQPIVEQERLGEVLQLEHDLLPMYIDMRWRGTRIDVAYAEKLRDDVVGRIAAIADEVARDYGAAIDSPWAAKSVGRVLEREGVHLSKTPSGQPSVTQLFLERCSHPFARKILEWRQLDKLRGTFLEGQIINQLHNGRVHGEIHPLKSDDGGTVTGRLSMSNPNLQFIPTRTDDGKLIRACFVADEGHKIASADFNQQELRLLVHYAVKANMPGAREAQDRYINHPDLNYHEFVAEVTGLNYKHAKIINFAIIYGRGIGETAAELGKTEDETKAIFAQHAKEMPFARALSKKCMETVQGRGYIVALSGRRSRFDLWEPRNWDKRSGMLPLEKAQAEWPGDSLVRARAHKALNSLIQPSAADQMKKAMRNVYRSGLGDYVRIQVHDELVNSVPDEEIGRQIGRAMVEAVDLEIPSKVDVEFGNSWKDAG